MGSLKERLSAAESVTGVASVLVGLVLVGYGLAASGRSVFAWIVAFVLFLIVACVVLYLVWELISTTRLQASISIAAVILLVAGITYVLVSWPYDDPVSKRNWALVVANLVIVGLLILFYALVAYWKRRDVRRIEEDWLDRYGALQTQYSDIQGKCDALQGLLTEYKATCDFGEYCRRCGEILSKALDEVGAVAGPEMFTVQTEEAIEHRYLKDYYSYMATTYDVCLTTSWTYCRIVYIERKDREAFKDALRRAYDFARTLLYLYWIGPIVGTAERQFSGAFVPAVLWYAKKFPKEISIKRLTTIRRNLGGEQIGFAFRTAAGISFLARVDLHLPPGSRGSIAFSSGRERTPNEPFIGSVCFCELRLQDEAGPESEGQQNLASRLRQVLTEAWGAAGGNVVDLVHFDQYIPGEELVPWQRMEHWPRIKAEIKSETKSETVTGLDRIIASKLVWTAVQALGKSGDGSGWWENEEEIKKLIEDLVKELGRQNEKAADEA